MIRFLLLATVCVCSVATATETSKPLKLLVTEDFTSGPKAWEILDGANWKLAEIDGNAVLSQYGKERSYEPPHRSPLHVAILRSPIVGDFDLKVRVRSTHEDYGHRDACLFFGYQDAEHFYYVHLGKKADPHCNQIFIVNKKDRAKITTKTTPGTQWDDKWHTVRIRRRIESGEIAIYWDDEKKPIMTATDKTFAWGRVGVGSFDDTADWDDVELRGVIPAPEPSQGDFPASKR